MKTRSFAVGIIIAAALAAPFAASALSIDDLQQQIKDLLSKVASLQVQLRAQTTASSTAIALPAASPSSRICAVINRNLSRGQSGDDVRGLQEFLSTQGFLNASATGYFGPATAAALAKWQSTNGISALGSFGPLTRERIKVWCGNQGNGLISVSPQKGAAPLSVTVTSKTGDASDYRPSFADGRDTMIDFGDGSERQWVHCAVTPQDSYPQRCVTPVSFNHTYTSNGTYIVSLMKTGGFCAGGCKDETLASERVVVGDSVTNTSFSADPEKGSAPLTVTFTTSVGINDAAPSVDFGDGQKSVMTKGSCIGIAAIIGGQGGIRCAMTVAHTYTQNGSYTALLNSSNGTVLGKTAITVGDNVLSGGSLTADPQNGAAPLAVAFTFHPATDESGGYWIDFGDGNGQQMDVHQIYCIRAPCISPSVASHTYGSAGSYTAVVTKYISCAHTNPRCLIATLPLAQTTVTVTGTSGNGTPVISSFSGPTSLSVNEIGTWKITASDPENGTLSYSVLWGDEWTAYDAAARSVAPSASIQQSTSFTHSYSNPGTYTVALTVTDATGKSARTTGTVQVSQTACTADYAPVCGRPSGCANTCAAGQYCTLQCQLYAPQTYSNRCQMNNSNATFMHDGVCTGNEGFLQ